MVEGEVSREVPTTKTGKFPVEPSKDPRGKHKTGTKPTRTSVRERGEDHSKKNNEWEAAATAPKHGLGATLSGKTISFCAARLKGEGVDQKRGGFGT